MIRISVVVQNPCHPSVGEQCLCVVKLFVLSDIFHNLGNHNQIGSQGCQRGKKGFYVTGFRV